MKISYLIPQKAVYFFILALIHINANAQINKANIIKHYSLIDSTLNNKDVHLLLFKDNTFLNYGIYDNKQEKDIYVWYANGTYKLENSKLILQSSNDLTNSVQLINDVKNAYKLRKDYALINNYLEFVWEKYKDYSMVIIKNKLFDEKKKYEYHEIN